MRILQGLHPALSSEDGRLVDDKIRTGELFASIKDTVRRRTIRDRLFSATRMISSMYTMINNTKFLSIGRELLARLLPVQCTVTMSKAFAALHNHQATNMIQKCEFVDKDVSLEDRATSAEQSQWTAYRMLWLLVLRHFPYMSDRKPLRDSKRGEQWVTRPEPQWWVDLCDLAKLNGYNRIQRPYQDHNAATKWLTKEFIEQNNPKEYYQLDKQDIKISWIKGCVNDREKKSQESRMAEMTSNRAASSRRLEKKCGIPYTSDYEANRKHLFFDEIYSEYREAPGRFLTPFAYFREFFLSFFGTWDSGNYDLAGQESTRSPDASRTINTSTSNDSTMIDRRVSLRRLHQPTSLAVRSTDHLGRGGKDSDTALSEPELEVGANPVDLSISPRQLRVARTENVSRRLSIGEASGLLFSQRQGMMFNILMQDGDHFRCKRLKRTRLDIAENLESSHYLVPEMNDRALGRPKKRLKLAGGPVVIAGALQYDFDAAIEGPVEGLAKLRPMFEHMRFDHVPGH